VSPLVLRSVVYRFGNDAAMCAAAGTVAADALLLDLEDSVAESEKTAARARIAATLAAGGFRAPYVIVRVNGLHTAHCDDDLRSLTGLRFDALMLPKTESGEDVRMLARLASALGVDAGVTLWAMIETPAGALRAEEICRASPRLAGIAVGTGDLSRGLFGYPRFTVDRLPLLPALGHCLLAARAAGVMALDGGFRDPSDPVDFAAACRASRALGFDGRTIIDSALAPVADRAYAPDQAEIDWAQRVVATVQAAGDGRPALLDGRVVEPGHLTHARRLLALAAAARLT